MLYYIMSRFYKIVAARIGNALRDKNSTPEQPPYKPTVYYSFWGAPYVKSEELVQSGIFKDTIKKAKQIREELAQEMEKVHYGTGSNNVD